MTVRLLLTVSLKFEIRGPNDLCFHSLYAIHEMFPGELKDYDEEGQISSCSLLSARRFACKNQKNLRIYLMDVPYQGIMRDYTGPS